MIWKLSQQVILSNKGEKSHKHGEITTMKKVCIENKKEKELEQTVNNG